MTVDQEGPTVAKLIEENEQLRLQVEEFLKKKEAAVRGRRRALGYAGRVFLGRELRSSARAWFAAASRKAPLPPDETADLLAAVVRRVIRVGAVGIIAAIAPGVLLFWQSLMMNRQNKAIHQQNETIQNQFEQQSADTLIVRRAQLLATIYDEVCQYTDAAIEGEAEKTKGSVIEPPPRDLTDGVPMILPATGHMEASILAGSVWRKDLEDSCQPRAHPRARQEATIAFAEIERQRTTQANLRFSNQSFLDFYRADLQDVDFNRADFRGSVLIETNLRRTRLFFADFSGAKLYRADLTGARLNGAILSQAMLNESVLSEAALLGVDLHEAKLQKANLSQADLRNAQAIGVNLSGADLSQADLRGAVLREAELRGANFSGAQLEGTDLSGANLSISPLVTPTITQQQIDSSIGDANTQLPPHLVRPKHWSG